MAEVVTIEKNICLDSCFLSRDINRNIYNKLKDVTTNECTQEYGYIIGIKRLKKIKDSYISSNSENIFIVEAEAEVLKPAEGKLLQGSVCMVFYNGIFLNVLNKQKVLVPITKLQDFAYDQSNNCYKHKKTGENIVVGNTLTVKISGCQYGKKSFICFGELCS